MARVARVSRGGPGYVGLIVLIVVCLGLIGGYVWLVPAYAKRGTSLIQVQRDIKQNLEDPLQGKAGTAKSVASESDVAYDQGFFQKVGTLAADGLKYKDLVALTGFLGDDTVGQVQKELGKVVPPQESLRTYIEKLGRDVSDLGNRLAQANSALEQANAKRDEAQGLAKQTTDTLNKERADAAKQLEDARKNYNAELAKTKELLTKANADTKKALDENTALAEKAKKDLAELQAKLQRAAQDIQVLKDEVERKKPKQLAVQEGHVLQADLVEGVVILDLGKREGIQTGEKFTIMNIGKGGKRIPKAEVQVVKVEDLISRADIIKHSLDDPIVREDIAQREKKVEPVD